jgi:nucleotide-binding universal stress UspA family protein
MSERTERRFERVCVALEGVSAAGTALDIAAGLAAELEAELAGFFVEDENVLRAAALPFTRDVGFVSGTSRPMRLEEVQRALRAQARHVRASLATIAEQLRLRWSFTTLSGIGIAPVLDLLSELQLTVMAPRSPFGAPRALYRRASQVSGGSIGVVYDGSEEALDAVHVAAVLARSRAAPLVLLVADGGKPQARDLQRYVHAMASGEVQVVSRVRIEGRSIENMADAARAANTALLVVPLAASPGADLRELLGRVSCPLVMIGAERQRAHQTELADAATIDSHRGANR